MRKFNRNIRTDEKQEEEVKSSVCVCVCYALNVAQLVLWLQCCQSGGVSQQQCRNSVCVCVCVCSHHSDSPDGARNTDGSEFVRIGRKLNGVSTAPSPPSAQTDVLLSSSVGGVTSEDGGWSSCPLCVTVIILVTPDSSSTNRWS